MYTVNPRTHAHGKQAHVTHHILSAGQFAHVWSADYSFLRLKVPTNFSLNLSAPDERVQLAFRTLSVYLFLFSVLVFFFSLFFTILCLQCLRLLAVEKGVFLEWWRRVKNFRWQYDVLLRKDSPSTLPRWRKIKLVINDQTVLCIIFSLLLLLLYTLRASMEAQWCMLCSNYLTLKLK